MAKDDYFVIAYKILKYLYACLKKGAPLDLAVFDADAFGIVGSYWNYIMVNLFEDGYIADALLIPPTLGDPEKRLRVTGQTKITPRGIQYLEENSVFEKVRGVVKDFSGVLP